MRNGLSLLKGNRFEWICGTGGNRAVSSFHEFIPYFFSPSLSLFSLAFPWWNLFQSVESLQSCCTVSRFTVLMGQLSSPFPPFLCVLGSSLPPLPPSPSRGVYRSHLSVSPESLGFSLRNAECEGLQRHARLAKPTKSHIANKMHSSFARMLAKGGLRFISVSRGQGRQVGSGAVKSPFLSWNQPNGSPRHGKKQKLWTRTNHEASLPLLN